ncbi:hypothetical protein GWA01_13300 [Gluconobacter wancherniae NBRC 103581]|uniref:Uncharacterized protein n=1 Tax=Gluconobacter wancherniae NBRC 103581 TaxID=656744 RepID=A0A511AZD4_9PROT|nr:hypothetical protein AA103581_2435 [Gluconobacter wancherniae NBRC 103581]GEK93560.1 hypothetical protein GWA01_13300 [Gluconobacter wancherniae NBRC 103581]
MSRQRGFKISGAVCSFMKCAHNVVDRRAIGAISRAAGVTGLCDALRPIARIGKYETWKQKA